MGRLVRLADPLARQELELIGDRGLVADEDQAFSLSEVANVMPRSRGVLDREKEEVLVVLLETRNTLPWI